MRDDVKVRVASFVPECCSFSAVSAPIFARKYAFCSIFQNLPDYLAEIFETIIIWQNLANFATFAKILLNFHKICWFFKPIFCEIFEIAAVQKDANLVDLVKSFPRNIYLQESALIEPRTSLSKFGGKFNSLFIRLLNPGADEAHLPFFPRRG